MKKDAVNHYVKLQFEINSQRRLIAMMTFRAVNHYVKIQFEINSQRAGAAFTGVFLLEILIRKVLFSDKIPH